MRALMITTHGSGVAYYRFDVPYRALRERMDVDLWMLHSQETTPEKLFRRMGAGYDLVHNGYITDLSYIEAMVAARHKYKVPFITDIDDDILNVPSYNQAFDSYHHGAPHLRMARMHLRVSDAVTASTEPLAKVLHEVSPTVLPNALDPADWKAAAELPDDDSIRIMFAGNLGRMGDLQEVGGVFKRIMGKYKHVRLFFLTCIPDWASEWMSDKKDPSANRAFAIRRCTPETYRSVFMYIKPDIVFAPIKENEFNKSKSHIKAYDAAMCGAAFICTDYETYGELPSSVAVKVDTEYQWEEGLDQLISDADLRARLARRLREWAVAKWHVDKHIHKWVELYERVLAKGPITDLSGIVRPGGGDGVGRSSENSPVDAGQAGEESVSPVRLRQGR